MSMVTEGEANFIVKRERRQEPREPFTRYILYIPTHIAKDGTFPLKKLGKVWVLIEGERLIIEPLSVKQKG